MMLYKDLVGKTMVLKKGGHLVMVVPYHGVLKNVVVSVVETRHFGRLPYLWRVFALVLQK